MKIIVLMGSPNRNGSTGILVDNFIQGAEEAGHFGKVCSDTSMVIDLHFLKKGIDRSLQM